jgi:hypothetical protein
MRHAANRPARRPGPASWRRLAAGWPSGPGRSRCPPRARRATDHRARACRERPGRAPACHAPNARPSGRPGDRAGRRCCATGARLGWCRLVPRAGVRASSWAGGQCVGQAHGAQAEFACSAAAAVAAPPAARVGGWWCGAHGRRAAAGCRRRPVGAAGVPARGGRRLHACRSRGASSSPGAGPGGAAPGRAAGCAGRPGARKQVGRTPHRSASRSCAPPISRSKPRGPSSEKWCL